jgi:hypothetical protein
MKPKELMAGDATSYSAMVLVITDGEDLEGAALAKGKRIWPMRVWWCMWQALGTEEGALLNRTRFGTSLCWMKTTINPLPTR